MAIHLQQLYDFVLYIGSGKPDNLTLYNQKISDPLQTNNLKNQTKNSSSVKLGSTVLQKKKHCNNFYNKKEG